MNKTDRDLYNIFNLYFVFRFIIILFNIFEVIMCFIDKPKLIIVCIILNIIYFFLYYRRLYLNIISAIICYIVFYDIITCLVLGLAIGNTISYLIDRIEALLTYSALSAVDKISKK